MGGRGGGISFWKLGLMQLWGLMESVVPDHGRSCTVSTYAGGSLVGSWCIWDLLYWGPCKRDVSLESCSPCAGLV